MGMGWRSFFLALHVVTLVGILVLFARHGFVDPAMYEASKRANATDALHFALQVGRLDIVSLIVALYAVVTGIAAVFGFIEVRHRAEGTAKATAETEAKARIRQFLDEEAPGIIRAHVEYLTPPTSGGDGEAIARAYGSEAEKKIGEGS